MSKDQKSILDPSFTGALRLKESVLGTGSLSAGSLAESLVPIIPCPIAWGWVTGGVNGIPIIGALGCDGKSGNFKTALSFEHLRWTLMAGGVAVYIDNEERPNPQYLRSVMSDLPYEARMNLIPVEVSSIDDWINEVFKWKKKAMKFLDKEPNERVPITVVVDSLTGRGTKGEQSKAQREGIKARDYSEAAMSISRFYKNFSYEGQLFTVFHVQHMKKSQDSYASGDDVFVANGGDEPRYASNYHFRVLAAKEFKYANYEGRDLTVKCIKSFVGPNKRILKVRVCWRFEYRDMPVFDMYGDGEKVVFDIQWQEDKVSPADAVAWWEDVNAHLPIELAYNLGIEMHVFAWKKYAEDLAEKEAAVKKYEEEGKKAQVTKAQKALDKFIANNEPPTEVMMPVVEKQKVQFTWFDWDFSLGWLLAEGFLDKDAKASAGEKNDLRSFLPLVFSGANKGYAKCKEIFGDAEPRSFSELGTKIRQTPELYQKVRTFLGIKRRMHFRKVPKRMKTEKKKK